VNYKDYIRDVPDFPKPGVVFKDITPLLQEPQVLSAVINDMKEHFQNQGIQKICGIESRGFIFGMPLALALNVGFVPVRKKGKLPWTTFSHEYALEYGTDKIEIHTDAVQKNEKVLIVDDLLATGGTAEATCRLLEKVGAQVMGLAFLVELSFLKGRKKIDNPNIFSLVIF